MAYSQMDGGQNPHVNYEPSNMGGLKEAQPAGMPHMPQYTGRLTREKIDRQNNFKQAGERYRTHEDWEREDLIKNIVANLSGAVPVVQEKMIDLFTQCDADYGRRVAEGLKAHAAQAGGEAVGAPLGAAHTEEAVQQAEANSKEAKPY